MHSKLPLLVLLLASSLFFGFIFAVSGAGMYGSPLSGFPAPTVALRLVIILVAPVALLTGLLVLSKAQKTLGTLLIVSALLAAGLGLCDDFRYGWEWVFLIAVWGPMVLTGFWLCLSDNIQ